MKATQTDPILTNLSRKLEDKNIVEFLKDLKAIHDHIENKTDPSNDEILIYDMIGNIISAANQLRIVTGKAKIRKNSVGSKLYSLWVEKHLI